MGMRWGLGPVFTFESLLNARRWQVYTGRAVFVLILLVGMVCIWFANVPNPFVPGGPALSYSEMAEIGKGFFYALTGIQVTLVLLAAPAAAAGSIGMDRARGTIVHMLVTDLSDSEIVLGTLAARLAPVCGMIVCGVPVTALAALLGGIEFGALAGAFVVSLALAVLGCALALTLSVWVTKVHEVLMAVYAAEALWLLSLPIWWSMTGTWVTGPPAWFQKTNPYVLVFAPYAQPGFAGVGDFAVFVLGVLAFSSALLGLSIARLRRVVVAQSGRPEKGARRRIDLKRFFPSWPGPTLEGNPVLWREWHRNRPTRLARWLWGTLFFVNWALAAWGTYEGITVGVPQGSAALMTALGFYLMFGLLLLSATAPTALAEERQRGSLDVLMTAPLSTRAIVVAKWWGAYRMVLVLLPLPLYAAVFLGASWDDMPFYQVGARLPRPERVTDLDRFLAALLGPLDFLASGAMIVSLGLLLATWVRRLGRVVALSVIAFFLGAIAWPILVEMSFATIASNLYSRSGQGYRQYRWIMECVTSLSPLVGPINAIETLQWYLGQPRKWRWVGIGLVIAIKAAVSLLLLWISVKTFDRCLGRVSEAPQPARGKKPVVLEALPGKASEAQP